MDSRDLFITIAGVVAGIIVTVASKGNRKLGHGIILGSIGVGGITLFSKETGNGNDQTSIESTAQGTLDSISKSLNQLAEDLKATATGQTVSQNMIRTS